MHCTCLHIMIRAQDLSPKQQCSKMLRPRCHRNAFFASSTDCSGSNFHIFAGTAACLCPPSRFSGEEEESARRQKPFQWRNELWRPLVTCTRLTPLVRRVYAHATYTRVYTYLTRATYSFEKGPVHPIALPCRRYPVTYQRRRDPDKSSWYTSS